MLCGNSPTSLQNGAPSSSDTLSVGVCQGSDCGAACDVLLPTGPCCHIYVRVRCSGPSTRAGAIVLVAAELSLAMVASTCG